VSDLDWLDGTTASGDAPDEYAHGPCPCGGDHYADRHQKCMRCEHVFNGSTIGDKHLVRKHPPPGYTRGGIGKYQMCPCERGLPYCHYCLNVDDMRRRGWWQDKDGVWHLPAPDENRGRKDG